MMIFGRPGTRKPNVGMAALFCALVAGGCQERTAPPLDQKQIETIVRSYLMSHPEIISEALGKLDETAVTKRVQQNRTAIEVPFNDAWIGDPHADVTLVEFFDYACVFCRASVADVDRLVTEDKRLKVVFRELPVLGPNSVLAARASLEASEHGKFYKLHKALYASGQLSVPKIDAALAGQGLPALAEMREDGKARSELSSNSRLAQLIGLSGTPSFVVGDRVLSGAVGYEALRNAISAERAKAPSGGIAP